MTHSSPLIVLVHGAFSDASIWRAVSMDLQARGFRVLCPALPMRGLISDAAYLDSILANLNETVVLVGHSYGGSVISYPLIHDTKISALVFVAAFQPDAKESAGELNGRFPGSKLAPESLIIWPTPTGQDIYLKTERFQEVYAGDIDDEQIRLMSAAQRPIDASALGEVFEASPLWKKKPSWAMVATQDQSIPPEALRFMAKRAGSTVIEVEASHATPASRPREVVQAILAAIAGDAK